MKQQLASDLGDDEEADLDRDIVLSEYVSEDEVTEKDSSDDDDDAEDHITKVQ